MPFEVMYPDRATEMKKMVLDYMKVLRRDNFNPNPTQNDVSNGTQMKTIDIDSTGFPIAPMPQSWTKVKKANLEALYRMYITRHYRKYFGHLIQIIL
jgi:hypothetical protein